MSSQDLNDKAQLLRVALNTLADPAARLGYDTKLAASRTGARSVATRALATTPNHDAAAASTQVRAEALSLRADALALRADAMLLRAGMEATSSRGGGKAEVVASGAMTLLKRLVRALGLLVLVCVVAYTLTRLVVGGSSARRDAVESRANEKTALQEYYQTHGVRPANMAELELLEAERRRRENQGRLVDQNRDKQEREARRFEEESRRRASEVTAELRGTEEQARRDAERAEQQAREKQQQQYAMEQAEQRRVERLQQQWRETLRR